MNNKLRITQADITTLDPDSVDVGSSNVPSQLSNLKKAIGDQIENLELELKQPNVSDNRKQEIRTIQEKIKKDVYEFETKHKEAVSNLSLKRERLSNIYKELYRKYSLVLPESPQYSNKLIFELYSVEEVKKDLSLLKDKYLEVLANSQALQGIISQYQSEQLNLKLYFREELVKYERLEDKYFSILVNMLNTIIGSAEALKKLGVSEKYKDVIEFNDSLSDIKDLAREHYSKRQEKFMQSGLSKEQFMKKQSKYFNLFQQSDLSGGFWELDKESNKIKAREKSKKTIESEKEDTMDMIKKALKDGGVWKYSIGDSVAVDSDFGFVSATIEQLLPGSNYLLKNDTHFKDGITVSESQIFDTKDTI